MQITKEELKKQFMNKKKNVIIKEMKDGVTIERNSLGCYKITEKGNNIFVDAAAVESLLADKAIAAYSFPGSKTVRYYIAK